MQELVCICFENIKSYGELAADGERPIRSNVTECKILEAKIALDVKGHSSITCVEGDKSTQDVLTLLNKKSGLLGIAGGSLDTRELVKRTDHVAKLALEMFSYRVRLAVGAYLAALGSVEAALFGGGTGEDLPWLREAVCRLGY